MVTLLRLVRLHAAGSSQSAMDLHMLDCSVSIGLDTSLEYVESNGSEYARGGQFRWGNNFGGICHHVDTGYSDVLQSMYCKYTPVVSRVGL